MHSLKYRDIGLKIDHPSQHGQPAHPQHHHYDSASRVTSMEVPPLLGHLQHHQQQVSCWARTRSRRRTSQRGGAGGDGGEGFCPGGAMVFSRYWAEDSVPNFASSIDFHFYKRVEISGMIVVLLSMWSGSDDWNMLCQKNKLRKFGSCFCQRGLRK